MTSAQLGDVAIEYEVDGPDDGEPMLLVMGLGAQLVAWPTDIVSGLVDRGFRVIRMDNRDIGLSTKTEGPVPTRAALFKGFAHRRYARSDYLLSDMAADAVALLDHLGVGAAHVVGVSMGGMIAQQLTIDHPDRVLSLCSIMSNTGDRRHGSVSPRLLPTVAMSMSAPRPEDPTEAERLAVEGFRLIAGPHFDADEIGGMVRTAIGRNVNPLGTIRQLVAIQASPDRTADLRQVRVPTLVVHGLRDQLVMPSGGIATARAVPGSRLVAFPDMAHDLPGPRRAEIVEEITRNAERGRTSAGTPEAASVRADAT
jgi:pimeloyl-ACP methyl ester carboxylesterase